MNKRWRWWLLVAVLVAAVAKAALPLLLVEQGLSMATGFVIRQAGKEALMSVGIAANDATWATSVGAWAVRIAAMIGFGQSPDGTNDKYQVALRPDVQLPKGSVTLGKGTWDAPLTPDDPSVQVVYQGYFCRIPGPGSTDGLTHTLPPGTVYAGATAVIVACNALAAQYLKPGTPWYSPSWHVCEDFGPDWADWCDGPIQTAMDFGKGDTAYYVQRFWLCGGVYQYDNTPSSCSGFGAAYGIGVTEGKDGVKRMLTSPNGGLIPDSTDPDWTASELASMSSPSQFQWKGTAPDGAPVTMALAHDPNVGFVVQEATQAGQGVVYRSMTLNPATSVVDSTVFEKIADTNPDAVISTAASPGTSGSGQTSSWPSDYARQGEAAAAANTVVNSLNQLHKDLSDTSPAPADPSYSKEYTDFGDTFNGLLGWQLPAHSGQCPTGSFVAFDRQFVLDTHCTIMEPNEAVIHASMMAAWTLLALFIVLRA